MGDTTNATLIVHACPREQAHVFASFIGGYFDRDEPKTLRFGDGYQDNDVSTGLYEEASQLADAAPGATFAFYTDPAYEWLGTAVFYTPDLGSFQGDCDADGNIVLGHTALSDLLDAQPHDMTIGRFRAILGRETGKPWVDAFKAIADDPNRTRVVTVVHPED